MRILHVCPLPLFSGLEQYALLTALRQHALGHDITFVVDETGALKGECAKVGVRTRSVKTDGAVPLVSMASQYADLLLSEPAFDVIHLHSAQDIDRLGLAFTLIAAQRLVRRSDFKRPKVIQQNHIWMSHSKKDPLHWLTYKTVDEVWCSSEPARQSLLKFLPIPESKIKIINYGRDLKLKEQFLSRADARSKLGLRDDELVMGAIARVDPAKGAFELVNAALQVLREGLDFTLVMIGGPTENLPAAVELDRSLREQLAREPEAIRSRIKMVGGIPNAGTLMKAFDVYVQASYKETFSLALLDAQLAGLAVLGTSSGGTPEVVVEGKTGWLAEPESTGSMVETLKRALNDRAQWSSFGETAKARVEKDFSLDVVTQDILSRYARP